MEMVLRSEGKRAYWEERVCEWEASGLKQGAYCAEKGIKLGTFKRWLRCIRSARRDSETKVNHLPPLQIIPVVRAEPIDCQSAPLILQQGNGWQLHLSTAVCPTWLGNVLKALV